MTPARSPPDGGWSWLVVIGNSIISLSLLPLASTFGLVFEEKFQNLGISTAETSLLLHLNSSITCTLGLASAPLLRRFTYRQVALLACTVASTAICLTSLANSMVGFIITYCVLLGLAQGILYPTTSLALSSHFLKRRSTAMSITITATGLGSTVTPQLAAFLLGKYGTFGTVLLLGGGALHSLIGASLLRPVPKSPHQEKLLAVKAAEVNQDDCCKPEPPAEWPMEFSDQKSAEKKKCLPGLRCVQPLARVGSRIATALDLALLKDPIYLSIVAGMGVSFVSELNFNMLIPFILAEMAKLPRATIATLMSVLAIADTSARLLVPWGADKWRWSARSLYALSLLGSIIGRSVLAYCHTSLPLLLFIATLLGTAKGVKAVFQALVIPNYAPLDKLPAANGLLMVINGILSICLGPFIGFVRDASESHIVALHTTSAMSLFCVLLWIAEASVCRNNKTVKTENELSDFR